VEEGEIGEEQLLVVIHEGLLDRAIEASAWRSSWASWGGVPAPDAAILEEAGEVRLELAAVVGQHRRGALGQQGRARIKGAGGMSGVLGGRPHGKRQSVRPDR
jgi:hypothetical protein